MTSDRMFRVIVLGGIGLVGCGGIVSTGNGGDATAEAATDAFPHEGKVAADAPLDRFPAETDTADVFRGEGPILPDSSVDVGPPSDAKPPDGFPIEA
jgi:hypothetical protein